MIIFKRYLEYDTHVASAAMYNNISSDYNYDFSYILTPHNMIIIYIHLS